MECKRKTSWSGTQTGASVWGSLLHSVLITLATWFGGPTTAAAQVKGDATSNPPLIYVPSTAGGITEVNSAGNVVFGTAPWAHGSNGGIAITSDGSKMYVSNLKFPA